MENEGSQPPELRGASAVPDANGRNCLTSLTFLPLTLLSAAGTCRSWCGADRASHTVISINAGVVCAMRRNRQLLEACQAGDLLLADGMSVVWAVRMAGFAVPERVAGIDLMSELVKSGGLSVYFLGAQEHVARKVINDCARRYPDLTIAGYRNGYFSEAEHASVVEEIRRRKPDILFVGMPSPFREIFCQRYRDTLNVPVRIGVGGSFDVLAGFVPRAPNILQVTGLEGCWRLFMEPRKLWKRCLFTKTEFVWLATKEILRS